MKSTLCLTFLSFVLLSCTNVKSKSQTEGRILRPIYSDFKPGMSMTDALRLHLLRTASGVYKTVGEKGKKETYEEHKAADGRKYYSSFRLMHPASDTILLGLRLAYTTVPESLVGVFTNESEVVLQQVNLYSGITDTQIRADLISKVSQTYGKYDSRDTLINPDVNIHIRYTWKNRNGVEITLEHAQGEMQFEGNVYDFYKVMLDYRYTDAMLERVHYRKSAY